MLIVNAEVEGVLSDITLQGPLIERVEPATGQTGDIDGRGGALLPGLHDHHIHLNASAAAMNSLQCGPPLIETSEDLVKALIRPGEGWLRGIGYHHSVAGEIDRKWLDENGPKRPVRIQHRGGRLWILNSAAMNALNLEHPENGRLLDSDSLTRVGSSFPELKPLVNRLLSYGITGVTEVTPSNGIAEAEHYRAHTAPLKLSVMGRSELSSSTGAEIGPLKLHYHDHNLPPLEDLAKEVAKAHASGRAVAAHCVTRAELMLTLAAIEEAGPRGGDRIEHAAIADEAAIDWMVRLGVIVVTQPNFITERAAAYIKDVPAADHINLWRLRAFIDAGLAVAAGSDAPFGDANPWNAMWSAVNRPDGLGEDEAISPEAALALYTKPTLNAGGPPRRIAAGQTADMCLLTQNWAAACKDLRAVCVRETFINGKTVYTS